MEASRKIIQSLSIGLTILVLFVTPLGASETDEDPQSIEGALTCPPVYSTPPRTYAPGLENLAAVWDRIDFFGDFRLRYQADVNRNKEDVNDGNVTAPSDDDRHTGRFRFRFGARYPFHEDLLFETRVRTQNRDKDSKDQSIVDDPREDDVIFGDAWRVADLDLDLLNLKYQVAGMDWLWVQAGKFEHIFIDNPVMGPLVWDPDLNPEGAAVGVTYAPDDSWIERIGLTVGEYLAVEQDRQNDVYTFTAQAYLEVNLGDHIAASAGSGYIGVSNPTPDGSTKLLNLNEDNYIDSTGDFGSKFRIFDTFAALSFGILELPFVISGEWIVNTGAEINQDHGWAAGIAVGDLKEAGDVRAYYQYQNIEQDALFSPFARSDFNKISNYSGSAVGLGWRFLNNMELVGTGSWVKTKKRGTSYYTLPRHETRIRVDLNILF